MRISKKLLALSLLCSFTAIANIEKIDQTETQMSTRELLKKKVRSFGDKMYFGYYFQYLGPSLSPDYQDGATYNRFKTGQDWMGREKDHTASHQAFHAITIGYKIKKDYTVSYAYTFQEDTNNKIKYQSNNLDGSTSTYLRSKGVSDNNKRINLNINNISNNKYFYINSTQFLEFASTYQSEGDDMDYGVGIEPSINFYNYKMPLYMGLTASIQRNYYQRQEFFYKCGDVDCSIPTTYQTLLVNFGAYANYVISDMTTIKFRVAFDWDQKGDEVNSTKTYNNNMHDTARIGANFRIDPKINVGAFVEGAMEDPSVEKSAIGANFSISM